MVVDCHRQCLFGDLLADNILIERPPDLCRFRDSNVRGLTPSIFVELFIEDALANVDAAIADVNARPGD